MAGRQPGHGLWQLDRRFFDSAQEPRRGAVAMLFDIVRDKNGRCVDCPEPRNANLAIALPELRPLLPLQWKWLAAKPRGNPTHPAQEKPGEMFRGRFREPLHLKNGRGKKKPWGVGMS